MCNMNGLGQAVLFMAGAGLTVGAGAPILHSCLRSASRKLREDGGDCRAPKLARGAGHVAALGGRALIAFELGLATLYFASYSGREKTCMVALGAATGAIAGVTIGNGIHEAIKGESTYEKSRVDQALNLFDRWGPRLAAGSLLLFCFVKGDELDKLMVLPGALTVWGIHEAGLLIERRRFTPQQEEHV